MKKNILALLLVGMVIATSGCSGASSAESSGTGTTSADQEEKASWKPTQTINIYCGTGAGGGVDLANRAVATAFSEYFGVPVNVTNMTGGGGGLAANHVYNQKHDGYSLFGTSDAVHSLAVQGAFEHGTDVWDFQMLTTTKGVLAVKSDSPYQTLEDLAEAAKVKDIKVAASQAGCVWYVKVKQINAAGDTNMQLIPYEGSSASVVAMMSQEVDAVLCGISELEDYILTDKIRPLATAETEALNVEGYGEIPKVADTYPKFADMAQVIQWAGIAIPSDIPEEVKEAYEEAWEYALASEPVANLLNSGKGVELLGLSGEEAAETVKDSDSVFAWILWDEGIATISPEEFGIERK